ncbi:hypothetical protein C0J52_00243 [Blattella germanica]|nr:hypothetical protein C0J52_00243 [Blattella germanica]
MDALWIILVLFAFLIGASSLHNVRLVLPRVVRVGDTATLLCQYDLEGAPLYSVKWYRGNHEFYRFTPREYPPGRVFPFEGITVDLSASSAQQVSLKNIPLHLSGIFSCEVSADAPSFSTKYVSGQLMVLEISDTRPVMTVPDTCYREGQVLIVNCTAQQSSPPRKLTFYINNVPVLDEFVIEWEGGATLKTTLLPSQFSARGELRLKCVASTLGFYNISSGSVPIWLHKDEPSHSLRGREPNRTGSRSSAKSQRMLLGIVVWMSSCIHLWTNHLEIM